MCGGASDEQKDVLKQQSSFMTQLMGEYKTQFGQNQAIMADLTKSLSPIIAAGPGQEGYSPAEKAALNTQAMESASANYAQTSQAVNEKMMARGGGQMLPSGAEAQVNAGIAEQAERQLSGEQMGIAQDDYATGRKNYWAAQGALAGVPGAMESPLTGLGGVASEAGKDAADESNSVWKSEQNSFGHQMLSGLEGGIGSFMSAAGKGLSGKVF